MSTFLNYTFLSFNLRNRQGARPFYAFVANIAAEVSKSLQNRRICCSLARLVDDSD